MAPPGGSCLGRSWGEGRRGTGRGGGRGRAASFSPYAGADAPNGARGRGWGGGGGARGPPGQPPELGREVGVAGACGGPGALGEDVEQPDVAVGGLARAAFPTGDVVTRCDPGPRGQVRGGGESGSCRR